MRYKAKELEQTQGARARLRMIRHHETVILISRHGKGSFHARSDRGSGCK